MSSRYELISAVSISNDFDNTAVHPSPGATTAAPSTQFVVTGTDGLVFPTNNAATTETHLHLAVPSRLGLRVIRQGAGARLAALLPPGALVNGIPSLQLAVLQSRDLLALPDGQLFYVSERITPVFGPPLPSMLGQKCAVCRIVIVADDFVLSCRCGAVLHVETDETTPHKDIEDRCTCGEKLKNCPACGHALSRASYLVFDPCNL